MDRVPVEIIIAFGIYLDGPSLYASLHVCREWFRALHPYVWRCIGKNQWHHPLFPIQETRKSPKKYRAYSRVLDDTLHLELSQVLSLEWNYNRHFNLRKTTSRRRPLRPQLPIDRLTHILTMTPNLVVLSLRVNAPGIVASLIALIINLPFLKSLSLDAPSFLPGFDIKIMFPLFQRLDELELEGAWPDRARTTGPMLDSDTPWALTRLQIDSQDNISLLKYCPALRTFEYCDFIEYSFGRRMIIWRDMYQYLTTMSNLTSVTVGNWQAEEFHRPPEGEEGGEDFDWMVQGYPSLRLPDRPSRHPFHAREWTLYNTLLT